MDGVKAVIIQRVITVLSTRGTAGSTGSARRTTGLKPLSSIMSNPDPNNHNY